MCQNGHVVIFFFGSVSGYPCRREVDHEIKKTTHVCETIWLKVKILVVSEFIEYQDITFSYGNRTVTRILVNNNNVSSIALQQ